MNYLTTQEARRRVTVLCDEGRIKGAIRKGKMWLIPAKAEKQEDGRRVQQTGLN